MGYLSEPIYELRPESSYYKNEKNYRDMIPKLNDCLKELNAEYGFTALGVWTSQKFGLKSNDVKFKELRSELKANSERDGTYLFKKTSKIYKELKLRLTVFDKASKFKDPFVGIDVLGFDNHKASHWVNNRWFFQTRFEEPEKPELLIKIELKDYLEEVIKSKEDKK